MFLRIFDKLIWILFSKINEKDGNNNCIDFKKRSNMGIFKNYLEIKCRIINTFVINEEKKTIELRQNLNKIEKMKILKRFFDLDESDQINFAKEDEEKSSLNKIFPEIDL